jgi:hypothetical protein
MFQDFSAKVVSFEEPQSPADSPLADARDLIARYPNLSEIELARLVSLYRDLSALDVGLMLSDERLAPRLDRFSADHRSRIRPPFRHYAALVGYAVLGVVAVAWAAAFVS